MKKLQLVTQGSLPGAATMNFAAYVAKLCDSDLILSFVDGRDRGHSLPSGEDLLSAQSIRYTGQVNIPGGSNLTAFEEACELRNVGGLAMANPTLTRKELITETKFTDAIILDPEYAASIEDRDPFPNSLDLDILHHAECPVLIAPPSFERLDEVIFTYDGSRSALHAIRQAIYLFPDLKGKKLTVLEIYAPSEEQPEDLSQLLGWLSYHFTDVHAVQLQGDSSSRLIEYLMYRPHALVVMGGFGRSRMSRLFKPSASETISKLVPAPIFIAHN